MIICVSEGDTIMLSLTFLMNSGVERTYYMEVENGADLAVEAEKLTSSWFRFEYLSGKDSQTGKFFFVRADDVSVLTIDICF
jgi:hypothetical protein